MEASLMLLPLSLNVVTPTMPAIVAMRRSQTIQPNAGHPKSLPLKPSSAAAVAAR